MTYELDSGKRFGLPPIGLPESDLSTGRSDTERRPMPGLATQNSVFAWSVPTVMLVNVGATATSQTNTVNFRKNTATGGSSVDVPTWAAGAVCAFQCQAVTMGTSTYHSFAVYPAGTAGTSVPCVSDTQTAVLGGLFGRVFQCVVPFFDEPITSVQYLNGVAGTGTASWVLYLLGFVRNV